MSDSSVTVKSAADGSLLLYSKVTGHLLQKLVTPSKYIRNRVTISSANTKKLTVAAKKKLIRQIQDSGKDIAVVLPVLHILPDADQVARNLTSQKRVQFHEKWGSESGSGDASQSEATETSSGVILLSACDSGDVSDVSSLATASWSPSEVAYAVQEKKEHAKQEKRMKGRVVARVNPHREQKAAARKRFKRRKGRVYDF